MTQNNNTTSLKIHFSESNIRKISLNSITDFESFQLLLNEQYERFIQQRIFVIQYVDEDNDFISVQSQIEWEAMIEEIKGRNFSVFIKFLSEDCDSDGESEDDYVMPFFKVFLQPLRFAERSGGVFGGFGGCDYGSFSRFHSKALSLMDGDEQCLMLAKELFLLCLKIVPQSSIALYNLACVESLLGNVDEAVVQLKNAINAGYDNLIHMTEDADFDNIKHTQGFEECVRFLSSEVDQPNADIPKTDLASLSDEDILSLPVRSLKSSMTENNISFEGLLEKNEFLERIRESLSSLESSDESVEEILPEPTQESTETIKEEEHESDPVAQISHILSQMGIYVEREELTQLSSELSYDISAIVNHLFSN